MDNKLKSAARILIDNYTSLPKDKEQLSSNLQAQGLTAAPFTDATPFKIQNAPADDSVGFRNDFKQNKKKISEEA